MKKKKILTKLLSSKIFIVFCLVVALFNFVSFSSFKPVIEKKISEILELPVKIDGDITLGFADIFPAISLKKIQIDEFYADNLEISPSWIKPSDGSLWHFYINAHNVFMKKQKLGNYRAMLSAYSDGFDVSKILGNFGGASVNGRLKYIGDDFNAEVKVKNISYKTISDDFDGNFDLKFNLRGKGKSYNNLMRNLSGEILVIGGAGKITSSALKLWGADLLSTLLSGKADSLKLKCAVADLNVDKGVASARNLFIDTKEMMISGKGSVNLVDETIKMRISPIPRNPSFLNMNTAVKIDGSLWNPSVMPETKDVAKKIGSVILSAVNPAAVILPVIEQELKGDNKDDLCEDYLKRRRD